MTTKRVAMQRKRIEEERDRLLREIEALRNKVAGLELALSLIDGEEAETGEAPQRGRGGLRQILADLLREAGTTGLNATTAVEIAQRRGLHLDRGSVSSTLSRMKGDGTLSYDGDRYRLVQFANVGEGAEAEAIH